MHKSKRAAQARRRRKRKSKKLDVLRKLVSAPGAPTSLQRQYNILLEERTKTLESMKECSASQRKKLVSDIKKGLPHALEKAKRHKKARQAYERKAIDCKAQQRSRRKVKWIKEKLNQQENINGHWVPWRRGQWTPLGVAIKLGDLEAVRWLLKNNASPSQYCTKTTIVKPLDLAAYCNKPQIVQILLENNGMGNDCKSYGALHLAIRNRMFTVVKSFIKEGYNLNESYFNQTPLGASLTCGKTKSGDVRLVKLLLDANADVLKPSKLCRTTYGRGELTDLVSVAETYSNAKCVSLLQAAYNAAKNQQWF